MLKNSRLFIVDLFCLSDSNDWFPLDSHLLFNPLHSSEVDQQQPMQSHSIVWLRSCLSTSASEVCTKLRGMVS